MGEVYTERSIRNETLCQRNWATVQETCMLQKGTVKLGVETVASILLTFIKRLKQAAADVSALSQMSFCLRTQSFNSFT